MNTLILSFLLLYSTFLFSQQYTVIDYRNESKLANQEIFYGTEGPDGKVYFLSRREIISYDGTKFKGVSDINSAGINFFKIVKDSEANLWFISADEKITLRKYNGSEFISILLPEEIKEVHAFDVKEGEIFLAADNGQIYIFINKQWQKKSLPEEFRGKQITGLKIFNGKLIITGEPGMIVYNNSELSSYNKVTEEPVYAFYFDNKTNAAWLLFIKALGNYNFTSGNFTRIENNIIIDTYYSPYLYLNKFSDSLLAFCAGHTHYVFNTKSQKFKKLQDHFDIELDRSLHSFVDSFNNTWLTSTLGITKVTASPFTTITAKDGLMESDVTVIRQFQNGDIITGHKTGMSLIHKNNIIKIPVHDLKSFKPPHVMDIVIDSRQRLWFLIQHEGIGRIDNINNPKDVKWFRNEDYYRFNTMHLMPGDEIFAAAGQGFLRIKNDKIEGIKKTGKQYFRKILPVSDSVFVLAAEKGLLFYDYKQNRILRNDSAVSSLYAAVKFNNDLLLGGRKGLFFYGNAQNNINEMLGRNIEDKVYFLNKIEEKNELWIGTNNGVYRWQANKLKHYTISEGLADNEINRGAFLYDKGAGTIWIGTINGLSVYNEKADYSAKSPWAALDSIAIREAGDITISFSSVSLFTQPEINYKIKLTGESGYFKEVHTISNSVSFSGLPEDKYTVEISAMDKFGNKSELKSRVFNVGKGSITAEIISVVLLIALCGGGYLIWMRKRRISAPEKFQENNTKADNKSYNINFFGSFTIVPDESESQTNRFSPLTQELFLLLVVHSFNGYHNVKGITSEKISAILWPDSSKQSSKNKRNIAIKRLRGLLEESSLGVITYENGKWFFKFNDKFTCDLPEWYNLREKFKNDADITGEEINKLLNIVNKGKFLEDISYSWLENIAAWLNNESGMLLSSIMRNENIDLSLRLSAGSVINKLDPLNENEFIYYIKLLHKSKKLSLVAYTYDKFCNDYQNMFGKNYQVELSRLIT